MKSSCFFFLLLCSMAVCQIKKYIFINEDLDWFSALEYCRENYVDLATITTDQENQRLVQAAAAFSSVEGWIGLNRTEPGSNKWKWSNGESDSYLKWARSQPDNHLGKENCVMVWPFGWNDFSCDFAQPFYCSWIYILVQDSKTWEEGFEYCRTYYTGLASPLSTTERILANKATSQTQTVSVWTGLRFMDGQWVSMENVVLQNLVPLPPCPVQHYRCGAYNTEKKVLENRDCHEKLSFLCY